MNIFIDNYWILKYLHSIRTLQTIILSEQTVFMKVICCSVCPFTNQATASEERIAVPPGNPNFSCSETALSPRTVHTGGNCPWKQQGRCKKTDLSQVAFVVHAELLHRLRCGSKQHKITSVKIGAHECKIYCCYSEKSHSGLFSSQDCLHHPLSPSLETSRICVTAGTTIVSEKTA